MPRINHTALCTRQGLALSFTQKISMGYITTFMMAITILPELSKTPCMSMEILQPEEQREKDKVLEQFRSTNGNRK